MIALDCQHLEPNVQIVESFHDFHGSILGKERLYQDPTKLMIEGFQVGDVAYRVNHSLHGQYEPPLNQSSGRFFASELLRLKGKIDGIEFIGRGKSIVLARKDWEFEVDRAIQRLLSLQDFERNENESYAWSVLGSHFDLTAIRYSAPLKIRAFGQLEGIRGNRYFVRWLDGKKTKFFRQHIPSELVGFRTGQSFEAIVLRDARTFKPLGISAAFPMKALPNVTEDEAMELFGPKAGRASSSQLDWD